MEQSEQISADARIRAAREVRHMLTRIRALGLTRPGGLAAGLGEDFALHLSDIPAEPEPGEPDRDLPPEIMRRICTHLGMLSSPQMRTGIELAIDTGRRPQQICTLSFECLTRDKDGLPVLVYDDHKGPPAADQRTHRGTDHRPAATGSHPLPPHPTQRAETAAHRPAQPRWPSGDHRIQPGICPPELD